MKHFLLFAFTLLLLFALCACTAVPDSVRQADRLCKNWAQQTGLGCRTSYRAAARSYTVVVTGADEAHSTAPLTLLRAALERCFAADSPSVTVVIVTATP